ncbi:YbaN family protein [Sedimentimonas flavescens]|uniref:YbaN family protein n=1 Tax=Sedimentimonas flavescens TaxID=2851012 RepID=UPI0021A8FDFD|nr:YbaN family protein [Sedimentimonas flavescens]MCT2539610.1 YbaN family protein [Sedimentimonas flavescens]
MRVLWLIAGSISLGLGLLGVFLPLLPTVPFVLLAAFCFARSSERLHDWMLEHPKFGPAIADWRDRGAISARGKWAATISIVASLILAVVLGFPTKFLTIQTIALAGVTLFIWTRPNG